MNILSCSTSSSNIALLSQSVHCRVTDDDKTASQLWCSILFFILTDVLRDVRFNTMYTSWLKNFPLAAKLHSTICDKEKQITVINKQLRPLLERKTEHTGIPRDSRRRKKFVFTLITLGRDKKIYDKSGKPRFLSEFQLAMNVGDMNLSKEKVLQFFWPVS